MEKQILPGHQVLAEKLAEIATFFMYPPEIRRIIYTTNIIEGYHRQHRKPTKAKSVFSSEDADKNAVSVYHRLY